jgi:flagellar motor switch protein FliN/FliY
MEVDSGTYNLPEDTRKAPEPQAEQNRQRAPEPSAQQMHSQPQPYQQQMQMPQSHQPDYGYASPEPKQYREPVNVSPAHFQNFEDGRILLDKKNINLIMDVPLQVTVELGRTEKLIKDILEFSPGSIIELDKLAGEPVDILVNGKAIAKGEVVVIDESFGVRVTDIIHPSKRL